MSKTVERFSDSKDIVLISFQLGSRSAPIGTPIIFQINEPYQQVVPHPTQGPFRRAFTARAGPLNADSNLPPYSPDFNPIENAFSKLKALLRARAERTVGALWDAVGALLDAFTPAECANYFAATGYEPD